MRRAAPLAAVAAVLTALALPQAASAHAVLVETQPARGASLERAPQRVVFRFSEPVEAAFGAVRVFDARGERVDTGEASRPAGDDRALAVRLEAGLRDGAYTATYRVISADSHPVSGGLVFTVGEGGAAARPVTELLGDEEAGPVTDAAFGVAKAVSYGAIALAVGGVLFLLAVWRPAVRAAADAHAAFAARLRRIAIATVAAGAGATAAGIVLQAATAAGVSAWSALDPDVIEEVLGTRFGTVWGLRLLDWLLLAALLALVGRRPSAAAPAVMAPALALPLGFLVVSPALSGHASTSDPQAVLLPANAVHVLGMSFWAGGLALLVAAVPAATHRLEPPARTRLLAASLERFSPLALAAVAALLATGVLQSIFQLGALSDLWGSAFGRAILVKAAILAALIGLGWVNRTRSVPRLRRAAESDEPPGREGVTLRRALRAEVALVVAALAATAALTAYAPPDAAAEGPFAATGTLGEARLELTVDPARVGANEVHLYLTDPRTGAQHDRFRDVHVALRLPAKRIGPLEPRVDKAGPGHWVARRAQIVPGGDWRLIVAGRVSEFEEHRASFEVEVR